MQKLPGKFLESINEVTGFDHNAFIQTHESGEQVTSIRLNPLKPIVDHFQKTERVPWTEFGYYLDKRPSFTFDPLFHAGCYYVQDASSMILEQPFKQLLNPGEPVKVLDLCAAPGGKSTHIQSILPKGSILVSNEVIRNRSLVLTDNIIKWGADNVIVTSNDPSAFKKLEGFFDVMVVDAPCSGSGLFRRDEKAMEEWSINNVQLCCQRQQRIIADALPALKEDGLFIYSTCSYSRQENEDISDWLLNEMHMESRQLIIDPAWNIVQTFSERGAPGYRFFPDKLRGEGFFLACFRKAGSVRKTGFKSLRIEKAAAQEKSLVMPWIKIQEHEIIKWKEKLFALTMQELEIFSTMHQFFNIQYAGVALGQIMKNRLVPEHALALGSIASEQIPYTEIGYEDAIKYLQRKDLDFNTSVKGWQMIRFKKHNLGWINALPNRINNYYPKEMRILKQSNDAMFEK